MVKKTAFWGDPKFAPFSKYYENYQIKENGMGGACRAHREMINVYKILVTTPETRRRFGRAGCWLEDNIKMHFKEVGLECVNVFMRLRTGAYGGLLWARYVVEDRYRSVKQNIRICIIKGAENDAFWFISERFTVHCIILLFMSSSSTF
jgi:hypothetical protein